MHARLHPLSSGALRLPVSQNCNAIRIAHIVGNANLFYLIVLIAHIVTSDPGTRRALTLAVPKVQPLFDRSEIGLPSRLQFAAGVLAVEGCVSDLACHGGYSLNRRVQRLSNIRAKTAKDKRNQICLFHQCLLGFDEQGWTAKHVLSSLSRR